MFREHIFQVHLKKEDSHVKTLTKEINVGYELPNTTKVIKLENLRLYEGWPRVKNIHTDYKAARQIGLPEPIGRGNMLLSYLFETLVNVFGEHWLRGGTWDIKFVNSAHLREEVTAGGKINEKVSEKSYTLFRLEVWVANQQKKLAVGNATVAIPF
jgi:hypothetical protein